ncbi:hypothetical protein D3C76_1686140 [compost metagenome]
MAARLPDPINWTLRWLPFFCCRTLAGVKLTLPGALPCGLASGLISGLGAGLDTDSGDTDGLAAG